MEQKISKKIKLTNSSDVFTNPTLRIFVTIYFSTGKLREKKPVRTKKKLFSFSIAQQEISETLMHYCQEAFKVT